MLCVLCSWAYPIVCLFFFFSICHKIIKFGIGASDIFSNPLSFFLLIFPILSTTHLLISHNCEKMNGNLGFVNVEFHTLFVTQLRIVKWLQSKWICHFCIYSALVLLSCGWNDCITLFSLWWLEAFSSYFPVVMTLLSVYLFCLQQVCIVLNFWVVCEFICKVLPFLVCLKYIWESFWWGFNYVSRFVCFDRN